MPYAEVTDNRYEVVSNREGDHHVWNYTTFPEGTEERWGYDSIAQGIVLSVFGEQVRGLLMDRYTRIFDELIDEEGVLPEDQVLSLDDAKFLAREASSDGPSAIQRKRESGERTRLSYEEALEEFVPLVGTVHHGCYLR